MDSSTLFAPVCSNAYKNEELQVGILSLLTEYQSKPLSDKIAKGWLRSATKLKRHAELHDFTRIRHATAAQTLGICKECSFVRKFAE